jgi:hypothetical protein
MKRFFKITFSIIGIIFLCLMIFGQIAKTVMKPTMERESQRAEFARMIERADRDCPIPAAMGKGAVTGIKLENGYVTYYLAYDSDFLNVLSTIDDKEKVKEGILMCLLCINAQGSRQGDLVMDLLAKFGYGIRVVITESATGRFDFKADVDEINLLREKYQLNPHEALYNLLSISIEAERTRLPIKLDEGFLLTNYSLEGEDIVITIQLDENLYSIDTMASNKDLVKQSMFDEGLSDPSSKALLDMCKVSHSGLKYVFTGKQSRKSFGVLLSSNEIRKIVQTPSNVNIQ